MSMVYLTPKLCIFNPKLSIMTSQNGKDLICNNKGYNDSRLESCKVNMRVNIQNSKPVKAVKTTSIRQI